MLLQTYVTISDEFKKLIQSGNYEELVLNIMNSSIKLFPNRYEYIDNQSHGECDFIDIVTLEKYDAKLPLTPQQGKMIGSNNANLEKWLETMRDEADEFAKYINNRGRNFKIETLTLHQIMNKRISSVNPDENIIFLFPYQIVHEQEPLIIGQFATDILTAIYDELERNNMVGKRKVYAIYPALKEKLVIRCLNTRIREFIMNDELKNYIDYQTVIVKG